METVEIPLPDDWHVHLRDDDMLAAVVEWSARRFRHALVMPNLRPPIQTSEQAAAYRDRIMACVPEDAPWFDPVMTLFVSHELALADLRAGVERGDVAAVKFYPPGATTNADQARGELGEFDDLFDTLTELGVRLLVHAESTRADVDLFDREAAFIEDDLAPVCARHPELGVTLEHVSTAAGVAFVVEHDSVVATITPHHLSRDRGHLLGDGMRPDLYCKPVVNSPRDRQALVEAATSANPSFFLGTDSAPHATSAKYAPKVAAGVFNAPYGLEVIAEVFHREQALDRLAGFVSAHGAAVYGVEPSEHRLRLRRGEPGPLPQQTLRTARGDEVVFFGTEEARRWSIELIS